MGASMSLVAPSLTATRAVAGVLARLSRPGDVVALAGEMGAGKTAFAQGFGAALGVTEAITSPTFTLVHSYDTPTVQLHHADVYRLEQLAELFDLALPELAEQRGVVLVEWGDVVAAALGDHLSVRLQVDVEAGDDAIGSGPGGDDVPRRIIVTPVGGAWATRWPALVEQLTELHLAAGAR